MDSWWLTVLGNNLIWARLHVRDAGSAEVLDGHGQILSYDSEDSARAALLDAEFVAYDGLDEEDALTRGFSLREITPPRDLDGKPAHEQMIQWLGNKV